MPTDQETFRAALFNISPEIPPAEAKQMAEVQVAINHLACAIEHPIPPGIPAKAAQAAHAYSCVGVGVAARMAEHVAEKVFLPNGSQFDYALAGDPRGLAAAERCIAEEQVVEAMTTELTVTQQVLKKHPDTVFERNLQGEQLEVAEEAFGTLGVEMCGRDPAYLPLEEVGVNPLPRVAFEEGRLDTYDAEGIARQSFVVNGPDEPRVIPSVTSIVSSDGWTHDCNIIHGDSLWTAWTKDEDSCLIEARIDEEQESIITRTVTAAQMVLHIDIKMDLVAKAVAYMKATRGTPEEKAAREAERVRGRILQEERQRKRAIVTRRARKLLVDHLAPDQREDYDKKGFFYLYSQSGKKYRIDQGTHGNVKLIEVGLAGVSGGELIKGSYCVQPSGVPDEDAMLAQKLHLEMNEEEFLRVANFRAWG